MIILVVAFFINATNVQGQNNTPEKPAIRKLFEKAFPDTQYVQIYKNKLLVAFLGTRKFQRMKFFSEKSDDKLLYLPNNPYNFGISLNYNWMSLDLTYKVPYLSRMYDKKGKTDLFRLRLGYNKPKLWVSTFMQYCKGWYLKNTESIDIDWFADKEYYPLRPDIINFSGFLSAFYSFNNKKITYQSSLGLEQRQKKSAGTFLLGGSLFLNYVHADSCMIPKQVLILYPDDMQFTEQMNVDYGLNFGYVHTFLLPRYFFITLEIAPGLHYQSAYNKSVKEGKKDISGDVGSVTESRAVAGFNNDHFYGGVSYTQINITGFPTNSVITNGYAYLKFFVGKRFSLNNSKKRS
jgi:hypothetical protein